MNYIFHKVDKKFFKALKIKLPVIFEDIVRRFQGENELDIDTFNRSTGRGYERLIVEGVEYSVKYCKKKQAVGIFITKNNIERLVQDDRFLNIDNKDYIHQLYASIIGYLAVKRAYPDLDI